MLSPTLTDHLQTHHPVLWVLDLRNVWRFELILPCGRETGGFYVVVNIRLLLVPLSPTSAFRPQFVWLTGPDVGFCRWTWDSRRWRFFMFAVGAVFPRSVPQPESERSRKEGKRCGRLKVAPAYWNKSSLTFTFCLSQINYYFMRLNLYTMEIPGDKGWWEAQKAPLLGHPNNSYYIILVKIWSS